MADAINQQFSTDNSANATGAQSVWFSGGGNKSLDQRSGYIEGDSKTGNVTGSGNLILGSGASQTTNYVQDISGEVVARALDSVDTLGSNAFDFGAGALADSLGFGRSALASADDANARALGFGGDALAASLGFGRDALALNDDANARALGFGRDALASADASSSRALEFGESSLSTLGDFASQAFATIKSFGESAFQGANQRAGDAVAAVERLAAVPAYRNAEAPEPLNKNLLIAAVAAVGLVLAVLIGGKRQS